MGYHYRIFVLLVCILTSSLALAQQHPAPTFLSCGAPELTDAQRQLLDREAKGAQANKMANGAPTALTYIPIRPHIFRQANGTGGMSVAKMNDVIGTTNRYYLLNGYGIQFYFCGTVPDYVDNNTYYNSFSMVSENAVANPHDVNNAMNMYFVHAFDQAGLGGYAYFPDNGIYSTRSFILDESDPVDLGNRLIPHELGHNFNLYHTFQGSTSATPELVTRGAGANCTTAGDLLCDTPADPYNRAGASTIYVNGCQQYNGTATDPQGAFYTPSITNLMSYYFPCTHDFTDGQYDRMAAGLALRQTHTAYSLTCAPTAVAAPANLSAVLAANGRSVSLTWQDLANNEMGYFVERSSQPTNGFGAVGGVGPNVGTYTDVLTQGQTLYYYRIRPSNSTTGSLSPVVSVTIATCKPTYTSSCSVTNGLAGVTVNGTVLSTGSGCAVGGYSTVTAVSAPVGAGQVIPVAATLLNNTTNLYTAVWVDVNRNGAFEDTELLARTTAGSANPVSLSLTLPLSLTAGILPMRVLTATTPPTDACVAYGGGEAEDYLLTVANPANCSTPTHLTASAITGTSAQLGWTASGSQFAVQYRPAGSGNWLAAVGINSTSFSLTGLTSGQAYEWQVLATCGASGSSPLSPISSFSTVCALPTALNAAPVYGNAAQLNWTGSPGNSYSLQWRLLNSSTWTTISGVTSTSYTLTSLALNTAYEWRVATICASGTSLYTSPATFTTTSQLTYCQPTSQNGCSYDDGLNGLAIGGFVLSSNSGCSPGAYQSFTTTGATLAPSQAYSFTATLLSTTWAEGLSIWADVDKNGTFDNNEQLYLSPAPSATFLVGTITLPANAPLGLLTLRVRAEYGATTIDPCAAGEYGETEDYVVNVATPCQPVSATLAGTQSMSLGQTASLTATFAGTNPWSFSVSNGSSFTGLTSSPFAFTVSPTASTTYTITQVSNNCGTGTVSGTAVVMVIVPATCNSVNIINLIPAATSVYLDWNQQAGSVYVVEWRQAGSSTWPNTLTATIESTTLTGLLPNTAYDVHIKVLCGNGSQSPYSSIYSFTTLPAADLSLAMAVDKRTPGVNEVVTYSITLSNAGPDVANNVKVQSLLPPNMTFVGSAQGAVTSSNGAVTIDVGTLALNTSTVFAFSAAVAQPGLYRTAAQITEASLADPDSFLNSGTADGDDDAASVDLRTRETSNTLYTSPNPIFRILPPVQLNQPAPGPNEADLSLALQTDGRSVSAGGPLSLSVIVANRGGLSASGVVVQLTLPTGWQLAAGSGFTQTGQSVSLPPVGVGLTGVTTTVVPLVASGNGEQALRALITAANQPDLDSPHSNAFGRGEDDEATATVRVR